MKWTDHEDGLLRRFIVDERQSFYEAEASFASAGYRRSRNSCIGRAHRLGFTSVYSASDGNHRRRSKPQYSQHRSAQPSIVIPAPKPRLAKSEILKLRCVEVDHLGIALDDLERGQCRYPLGDGPFTFCGQPADGTYCAPHMALTTRIDGPRSRMVREAA